jgi:hypothetical protein
MQMTALGKTGIEVSRLGFGLAELGGLQGPDAEPTAGRLLNTALDSGINFLDTAACYGDSEELIGNTIADRRDDYVLATKCGHLTEGTNAEPWSAKIVADNVERSLRRLRTDHVDLVQLHSCDLETLRSRDAIDGMVRAKEQGKTRFIGYSGDNEAAEWAVASGVFDTLQTSLSIVDQFSRARLLEPAEEAGMGVIIKRPVGNMAWGGGSASPAPPEYLERATAMEAVGPLEGAPDDLVRLALGFVLAHSEVDTAIVGTTNLDHLRTNIELVSLGADVPDSVVAELHRRFDELEAGWRGRT